MTVSIPSFNKLYYPSVSFLHYPAQTVVYNLKFVEVVSKEEAVAYEQTNIKLAGIFIYDNS